MSPIDPEIITDKFMYQIILSWELASLDAHVKAIIETIRNDLLRKLWRTNNINMVCIMYIY